MTPHCKTFLIWVLVLCVCPAEDFPIRVCNVCCSALRAGGWSVGRASVVVLCTAI